MKIQKRNGNFETVKFDKILSRIKKQTWGLSPKIDPWLVAKKVIDGLYDKVTTVAIDELAAEVSASMATDHYDYSVLASRIAISALHKRAKRPFSELIEDLYHYRHPVTQAEAGLISDPVYAFVKANKEELDQAIVFDRDFNIDYFGFKTLERSYLLKMNDQIVECGQHLWLRVACGVWQNDLTNALKTYELLSNGYICHATPTLYSAGTRLGQLSSCFLLKMEDSLEHIYKIISDSAAISRSAGGLGISISNVRAKGSYIKTTNGVSTGIVPMLGVVEATTRYVNQSGRRAGSAAIYLETFHADILDFLELRKNSGNSTNRTRDLFTALWVNDLFMQRVKDDLNWTLMCPDECPGLTDVHGEAFNRLYEKYEQEGRGKKTLKAREIWAKMIESQLETGTPYVLFKDAANRKSNQQNLGTIQQSNLCCIAGDQRVVTSKGLLTVKELYEEGTPNIVLGMGGPVEASEMLLPRPNAEMVKIKTREGYSHKVTPDHKVWVQEVGWVEAKDLLPGCRILTQQVPGIWGSVDLPDEALIAGFVAGDGCFSLQKYGNAVCVDLWNRELALIPELESKIHGILAKYSDEFNGYSSFIRVDGNPSAKKATDSPKFNVAHDKENDKKVRMTSAALYKVLDGLGFNETNKLKVPNFVWMGTEETVAAYLRGLFTSDATVQGGEVTTVSLCSVELSLLEDVQILLANFGIKTFINVMSEAGPRMLPDGKGGHKEYQCKKAYRLLVTSIRACKILNDLIKLGEAREHAVFLENIKKEGYRQKFYATFTGLEQLPNEDAYCLTVHDDAHAWTVNGLITKNSEIIEYTSKEEHATCNLASIVLPKFVERGKVDFDAIKDAAYQTCLNLNQVIDVNHYPVPETKLSNDRHRPIGIGIQGLGSLFAILSIPFDSDEAKKLDADIMETIYFGAMTASKDLAKLHGPYQSFTGSPLSEGKFQFNLAGLTDADLSGRWDWDGLRNEVIKYGVRNSLLIALMPTASTASIFGSSECFEPFTSNIYMRNTLGGSFPVVNKHLVAALERLNLWNEDIRNEIIKDNGSVQNIAAIPDNIKAVYKSAWEISQRKIIDMAASRGAFVCQSQSMNLFIENANAAKVSSALFYAWEKGLKTGMYYLRTRQKNENLKSLAIDMSALKDTQAVEGIACSLENPESCEACGA